MDLKGQYTVEVKNRYQVLDIEETKDKFEALREAVVESAKKIIPKKKKSKRSKWMADDILNVMEERRTAKQQSATKYKDLNKKVKQMCRVAKEDWLNRECDIIENTPSSESENIHDRIRDITGRKNTCSSSGCIKANDGTIIMDKEKILERWSEYIGELFQDERGAKQNIRNNMEGPPIIQPEVKEAIRKMKRNKATGPDEIAVELIKSLEEFGVEKLTELLNEVYDTGDIPEDMSKSIFIALPKKPGATECGMHRTISLMSHITKILLKILLNRVKNKTDPEIGVEQCGFVKDTGTRNAIIMLRILSERAIQVNQDIYACFIDYTKAFDKVQHEKLFDILQNLNIDGKDLRVIRNLYWEQTAAVRVEDNLSPFTKVERGVCQGCVLSPDLFNIYSEMILREIEDYPGIMVGGTNIDNLRYADDTVLLATNQNDLQNILDRVVEESARKGLTINCKKTECMVISKKIAIPQCIKSWK